MEAQRLDKFISSQLAGVSRKDARELIRRGEVSVNGRTVKEPEHKLCPSEDSVMLGGKPVGYKRFLYIMLNKPAGVICATRDRLSETVTELLPEELRREGLFPAGRLDKDSVGFVLITDDGALAHRLLSPKSHVPKTYFVGLRDPIDKNAAEDFARGVTIDGGEVCLPAELKAVSEKECLLTLHEGKYHQIKRMFACRGNEVVYLKRISIGGAALDPKLSEGHARELTPDEVGKLIDQ